MFITRRPITAGFGMLALVGSLAGMAAPPDGGQRYLRHCAVCHGLDGRGGVGVPLALLAFQSSVSDRYLETTIRQGCAPGA